jgi:tRNA-Thr(GGU) m(6)t(6)A37 methyltransferase TsaA
MTQSPADPDMRPGEVAVPLPAAPDAGVYFIGVIRTPWTRRSDCPKRGDPDQGPECRIVVDDRWRAALRGLRACPRIQVMYWMHEARRDLVLQSPRHRGETLGTFALRSPVRPNPIASSVVTLVGIEGATVIVRGLDCLDGTPLIDLKPDRGTQAAGTPAGTTAAREVGLTDADRSRIHVSGGSASNDPA